MELLYDISGTECKSALFSTNAWQGRAGHDSKQARGRMPRRFPACLTCNEYL